MGRPIDHLVLPCADLAASADAFARLGFQVGRRNRHPWGTENHIVQFAGAFLELIALAPDFVPLPPDADAFPFAGFLAGQADSRNPSGMVGLRAANAAADARDFERHGIGRGRMLDFARDAASPDGSVRRVAFTLAFAEAPGLPDLGFFTCKQLHPENFWNPAFQIHANGCMAIAGVVILAEDPASHTAFLQAFTGEPGVVTPDGLSVDTGGGTIEVVTPDSYRTRFGDTLVSHASRAPRLAAVRLDTMDFAAIPRLLVEAGQVPIETASGYMVRAAYALAPALVFGSSD